VLVGDPPPQEVMHDDVLVVLAQEPLRLAKAPALAHQLVVGAQERDVQLGDDEVLVVARVANQGRAVVLIDSAPRLPREVLEGVVIRPRWPVQRWRQVAERRDDAELHLVAIAWGGRTVDAIQVQGPGAQVPEGLRDGLQRKRGEIGIEEAREPPPGLAGP
jgi:hypothetical protein